MLLNPSKILFLSTLIMGTLISISSTSWLGVWMGLEINLLSFIPLMSNTKNIMSTEASLKYFLIQAIASSLLLFSLIMMFLMSNMSVLLNHEIFLLLISSALLLKLGAAPFHFWFPATMEGLNWMNNLILMTWQKIAPLMLLSYLINMNAFFSIIIISSIIIGSLGGLNQTSLRKLMAYSSINHLGWMIAAMTSGENLWELYFLIYFFLSTAIIFMFNNFQSFHINQNFLLMNNDPKMKFCMFTLLLSLGGLPPFLGFLPKWLIIQAMAELNSLLIITLMVITTLITLFYYIRITFSAFLFSYTEIKWNHIQLYDNHFYIIMMTFTMISLLGLTFSSLIFNIM
uniref:NADH-ubiquinone oxidoreductase chain 2 n=1 Tax=Chandozhinskia hastaticercus TaxID=2993978 RepID=A0A9E8IK96_9ORTH|nr:NADH dehydrogenase subunit 2 [Chandozhinskia hastaticercus]UZH35922.1 NADH dehydrogenase subunit 2 [Chandozhinskia hastaticercus]